MTIEHEPSSVVAVHMRKRVPARIDSTFGMALLLLAWPARIIAGMPLPGRRTSDLHEVW